MNLLGNPLAIPNELSIRESLRGDLYNSLYNSLHDSLLWSLDNQLRISITNFGFQSIIHSIFQSGIQ